MFLFLLVLITSVFADVEDYLILQDIEPYILFTGIEGRLFSGQPKEYTQTSTGGILGTIGHFLENDVSYESSYKEQNSRWPFVTVEVTHHDGTDLDQWLLHEISKDFRNYYGLPGDSFVARQIKKNTIIAFGAGGWIYRWLSGNKVINIEYTDLMMEKPEPIEIVNAYLVKHPSTLSAMTSADLRIKANQTRWIKDEMDRRLWLCDKWLTYGQTGNVEVSDLVDELAGHLTYFLHYREKYYGIRAKKDLALIDDYMQTDNKTALEGKLDGYKTWWADHKNDSISLP